MPWSGVGRANVLQMHQNTDEHGLELVRRNESRPFNLDKTLVS